MNLNRRRRQASEPASRRGASTNPSVLPPPQILTPHASDTRRRNAQQTRIIPRPTETNFSRPGSAEKYHSLSRLLAPPRSALDKAGLDSFKLSIPRLLGVLGEPNPPFGHFDEKGFMRRSASFLRQPNALSGVLA